jgi:hypothetical protein
MQLRSNVSLSDGQKNLQTILKELGSEVVDWNEANTRFHIIDRLLVECLGWPNPDISQCLYAVDRFGRRFSHLASARATPWRRERRVARLKVFGAVAAAKA